MNYLFLISPGIPILQNVDYFLYNLETEWGGGGNANKNTFRVCGNRSDFM